MNPQRRRMLLGVLGLAIAGYFVNGACNRFYFQPRDTENRLTASLEKRLAESRMKLKRLQNKVSQLADLEDRSLPADIEVASSLYQAWLLNLVTSLGIGNPTVDSVSPLAEGDLTRLQFSVRGKASLRHVTSLLFQFYSAGHLHKIRSISLTPTGGSELLDLQISVEALAFRRSKNDAALTTLPSGRLVWTDTADYQTIARRNIFGEGVMSTTIRGTKLTAITSDRLGVREAWIFVARDSSTYYLKANESLMLDSVELKIVNIETDSVTLELDGQAGKLSVGKSLTDFKPIN